MTSSEDSQSRPLWGDNEFDTPSIADVSDNHADIVQKKNRSSRRTSRFSVRVENVLGSIGWLISGSAALALSAWSLYWIGLRYGLPVPLAAIVSISFDGAAIVCADVALRYARTEDSGFGPRIGVFLFAGASAYLNSQHAIIGHDPKPARLLYASPPIIAVILFEQHSRYVRRSALRKAGRISKALPKFDRWAWILFPRETLSKMRTIVSYRLDETVSSAVSESVEVNTALVRLWARSEGYEIGDRGRIPGWIIEAYALSQSPASLNGAAKSIESGDR